MRRDVIFLGRCRPVHGKKNKIKERRHANQQRQESKSNKRLDGTDLIQVKAPRCAIRAEHLHLRFSDELVQPRWARRVDICAWFGACVLQSAHTKPLERKDGPPGWLNTGLHMGVS